MKYKTYWLNQSGYLEVLDQTALPFFERSKELRTPEAVTEAIKNMTIRGAGTIAGVAAYGAALAFRDFLEEAGLQSVKNDEIINYKDFKQSSAWNRLQKRLLMIREARPTAVNLMWAADRMNHAINKILEGSYRVPENSLQNSYIDDLLHILHTNPFFSAPLYLPALQEALLISDEDVVKTETIGHYGLGIINKIKEKKISEGRDPVVNILTHCNAGWLGIVNSGTALAPMYAAKKAGTGIHVWVDETRPRNQGSLTSYELGRDEVPHTVIADNTGGLLMMMGKVDMVITGADRVTRCGDTANKIGTYLKALAAKANGVPFYVALPGATFDLSMCSGLDIPIEERSQDEVLTVSGLNPKGELSSVKVYPEGTRALNYGFDITPASLITGLITERGICEASEESILKMWG